MSNFKIYDPSTNTAVDIASLFVRRAYIPGLAQSPDVNLYRLWMWGQDNYGQLGDATTTNKSSPVQTVAGGNNWKQVTMMYHTAAIKTDGTLWMWGQGGDGRLGDNTITDKSSPVQTVAGGNNWKQAGVGNGWTAAVKTDGTLWTWGWNAYGQLGDGTSVSKSSPVQVLGGGTTWAQVSAGWLHCAAIKSDGTLWTWGYGTYGGLGDNGTATFSRRSSPAQTIAGGNNWASVACAVDHVAAIKTDGTLWTWGRNDSGQLGDNTTTPKSSPVQTIAGGTDWKQVAVGDSHTVAIKKDGTLWTWGGNVLGRLGDNTTANKSSPVQTVAGGTNWSYASAGLATTGAIKTDGTLWMWGGANGSVGDNTTVAKSSPVQTVMVGGGWVTISCGGQAAAAIQYTTGS